MKQTSLSIEYKPSPYSPVFARHETFHPRFGWLKKGFDLAQKNPSIFLQDDALIQLGVGKNMVNSIRYWCHAFKILEEDTDISGKGRSSFPTEFGSKLLSENGWDSFLEDPASLWLLHWNLLKPTCEAASWYYIFNLFRENDFTNDDLIEALTDYAKGLKNSIADNSLKKDITCLLRMYVNNRNKKGFVEDSIDCPFNELGLIHLTEDSRYFAFRFGPKFNLPPEILVATCLEYASLENDGAKTIAISRLLYNLGSPGMVFKLTESAICDAIEKVAKYDRSISLSDSSGLIQLSFNEDPAKLSVNILERYYQGDRRWK